MKATIESIGKVGSRVRVGEHDLVFDQPTTVPGGGDRGPSPLDVMTVAVGACAHYYAAAYLYGRGLPPDGLAVEVDAEKERAPVARIGHLSLRVRVPIALNERQVAGLTRAIKSCPAYGTLVHPPAVEIVVEMASPPVAPEAP
ncbi:MAG TPA: OsmC family protein [Polyangia bacterium]|nr:OsmC family protein [Polyangia bacterium]